jgi:quercetin dioxygenase-like cupin family protein
VIRCVRLWSDDAGRSRVETGVITADVGALSIAAPATEVRFEESAPSASLDWHVAPHRQFVLTLAGRLVFVTRDGERFALDPDTVLLAEDTVGTGHRWTSSGSTGWRRAYVRLGDGPVPFAADRPSAGAS